MAETIYALLLGYKVGAILLLVLLVLATIGLEIAA